MFSRRILPSVVAIAIAMAATPAGVASAGFYTVKANVTSEVVLSPEGDVAFAVELRGSDTSLVSFSPVTGKRLGRVAFNGVAADLRSVRTGDSDRLVVLNSAASGTLDALIYDIMPSGKLQLRAEASVLTLSYYYLGGTLRCSSNGTFYLVGIEFIPELYAYSLDNGVKLGRSPLAHYAGFVDLVDGAHPTIQYFDYFGYVSGLHALDVTNPASPVDRGVTSWPFASEFLPPGVLDTATSGDGRYMFIADRYSGLWAVDLVTHEVIDHLGAPTQFAHIAIRERSDARSLVLTTWEGFSYTEQEMVLVDATDPHNLALVAVRQSPEPALLFEFTPNGAQLVVTVSSAVYGLDAETLETIWSVPVQGVDGPAQVRLLTPYGAGGAVLSGWGTEDNKFVVGLLEVPEITAVSFARKDIVVDGTGFDSNAVVLVNGIAQKTVGSDGRLRAKKALAHFAPGQAILVQVRNSTEILSATAESTTPSSFTE